jgi:ABC-type uncharacterized transport system involved in gliding motility auxiliary subunit
MNDEKTNYSKTHYRLKVFATKANVSLALFCAVIILILVNYICAKHYFRVDISKTRYYALSEKTLNLIRNSKEVVNIVAFIRDKTPFSSDIRNLLKEYEYAAQKSGSLTINLTFVDPDRELTKAKRLSSEYGIQDRDIIVFDCKGRRKYVPARSVVEQDLTLKQTGDVVQGQTRPTAFIGEAVFTGALQSVLQSEVPVIYFLSGHGEHDINDFTSNYGYGLFTRNIRQENMNVKQLVILEGSQLPSDCSAIVLAGPQRKLSPHELTVLGNYLDNGGRLLILLNPKTNTGIDEILSKWGVRLYHDFVVDPALTTTSGGLVVYRYGEHPITRRTKGMITIFHTPRSIEPLPGYEEKAIAGADRPQVSVLVATSRSGWAEMGNDAVIKFDKDIDRPGPIPIAVAIEKGQSPIRVGIKSSRLVVIGDSHFLSNASIKGETGGNVDFGLGSLNWLVEREFSLAVGPKVPRTLSLQMGRNQIRTATIAILGVIPGLFAILGCIVWMRRRH